MIKHLHKSPSDYNLYIPNEILLKDKEIINFIKQVSFEFPDKRIEKYDSIIQLNDAIENKLIALCRRQVEFYNFCSNAFYTFAENKLSRCFIL